MLRMAHLVNRRNACRGAGARGFYIRNGLYLGEQRERAGILMDPARPAQKKGGVSANERTNYPSLPVAATSYRLTSHCRRLPPTPTLVPLILLYHLAAAAPFPHSLTVSPHRCASFTVTRFPYLAYPYVTLSRLTLYLPLT